MGFSVQTVNAIVKRPQVRCLKLCPSMPDQVKISYEIVSKERLINGNSVWIYHFSEIRAFKMPV